MAEVEEVVVEEIKIFMKRKSRKDYVTHKMHELMNERRRGRRRRRRKE